MSEEMKQGMLDKEYSRRQFLKLTGKGIVGVSLTASMLCLFGCTQQQVDEGAVAVELLPQGLLVSNAARCTGCQRCELNCSLINDGKAMPQIGRVKVYRNLYFGNKGTTGEGLFGDFTYTPETCRQCKDAPCMAICPAKAIAPDPTTGARIINQELCVGCGACVGACPYNMATLDQETKKSTKCTTCGYCASMCPTGALKIVTWSELEATA